MRRSLLFEDGHGFYVVSERDDKWNKLVKLEGWYGGVGSETPWVERLTDGNFEADLRLTGRRLVLGFQQFFKTEQELVKQSRRVSSLFRSGEAGNGVVHVDYEGAEALTAFKVALDGEPRIAQYFGPRMLDWEVTLHVPDSYLYGPLQQLGQDMAQDLGLEYPLFQQGEGVLDFGEVTAPQNLAMVNYGNEPAYPQIEIDGTFPSGFTVKFQGDVPAGLGFTFQGSVHSSQKFLADMYTGRVFIDGTDQSFSLTERVWGGIKPSGQARLILTAPQGGGTAQVTMRSTYR